MDVLFDEQTTHDGIDRHLPGFGPSCRREANVGNLERAASLAAGALMASYGLFGAQRGRLPLAIGGAALVFRGYTGQCQAYRALGINTACERDGADSETIVPARHGAKIERAVMISRPAAELYQMWRDLANLPKYMRHLKRVEVDGNRSHWVAEGAFGREYHWDAEIFNDREGEVIAWRSLPGGDVAMAGSVHFQEQPHNRGTQVTVSLKYDPPVGKVGAWLAALIGNDWDANVAEDLRRFKRIAEAGEDATVEGQPSGRSEHRAGARS